MKTKLELAHEWAIELLRSGYHGDDIISCAWQYADAMQAEADKRINKDRPDAMLTKDKDGNCLHFHHEFGHKKCMDCGASLEEWQPDWSQAPDWANFLVMSFKGTAYWHSSEPRPSGAGWVDGGNCALAHLDCYHSAGDWRNSLRKRQQ